VRGQGRGRIENEERIGEGWEMGEAMSVNGEGILMSDKEEEIYVDQKV
jgi:hypothetical protein